MIRKVFFSFFFFKKIFLMKNSNQLVFEGHIPIWCQRTQSHRRQASVFIQSINCLHQACHGRTFAVLMGPVFNGTRPQHTSPYYRQHYQDYIDIYALCAWPYEHSTNKITTTITPYQDSKWPWLPAYHQPQTYHDHERHNIINNITMAIKSSSPWTGHQPYHNHDKTQLGSHFSLILTEKREWENWW